MEGRDHNRYSAWWGAVPGIAVAALVYLPILFTLRSSFDVPIPNPTPRELRDTPVDVEPSYWLSWVLSMAVLLAPTLVLAAIPRARRAAVGYLAAAGLVGGGLCVLVIGFELGGFAPS